LAQDTGSGAQALEQHQQGHGDDGAGKDPVERPAGLGQPLRANRAQPAASDTTADLTVLSGK
jgi:hypothetical protein